MAKPTSHIRVGGVIYDVKDADARALIATNAGDITALDARITQEVNTLNGTITSEVGDVRTDLGADIGALDTRVTALENQPQVGWAIQYVSVDEKLTFTVGGG